MLKVFMAIGLLILVILGVAFLGLFIAFPIMWCWNYVMPYIFGLPIITWGHAWCLNFLAGMLIQSTLSHNSSK